MDAAWTVHSLNQPPAARTSPDDVGDRATDVSEITLLNRIAARMSCAAPLHEILKDALEFVAGVAHCDSCMVYILEGEELVLRTSKNPGRQVVGRLRIKVGRGTTGWVTEHREPIVVARGACEDPHFKAFNELPEDRCEAFVSVPLVSGGRVVGVINLQNRAPHPYGTREISLIVNLGFLVAAEVERARLESENAQLSERLEARKLIERAKGILQNGLQLSEEEAYVMLQRHSQQQRKSMKEIADAIVRSHTVRCGSQ
jgi:uroporphyrinogen-III synthase